jgi:Mrp family chromosome partitioning ATPase
VFAATMANALVDAYLVAQAEATFENTRRLNEWLSGRVAVLAEAVAVADAAVDEYRRENDLFSVRGEMLPGRVELAAANDEVIATRNELVDVEAAIEQVRTLIAQGSVNANIGPESRTPAFLALQNEYTEILSRERELAARLGEDHGLVRQARQDRERTRQLIFEELKTIVAQLESRRETLRLQIERTMERIEALRVANAQDARKSIRLRELEREAESKRRLYETMLAKLDETSQQETFAPSAARIIAQAVPPDKKSAPRSTLVLALALFGGLVLGGGAAFLREALDDMFRRPDEVEDELGLPFIGIVPRFSNDTRMLQARRGGGPRKAPPAPRRTWIGRRDGRAREVSRLRFAAQNGGSMFAETLRAVAVSLKLRKGGGERCTVVGLTSLRKGEGKSTVAGNFATMQASRGYRVALVDLDVWQPTLAGTLTRVPRQNTLERLLQRPDTVGEIQPIEALEGVFAVTNAGNGDIVLADMATIEAFERLLGSLRERFDYVVVDLPAIAGLVDTRVAAEVVDALVLVVEWGRTPRGRLTRTLRANQRIHRRLVGAVYSKVRLRSYFAYNGTAVREYYEY